MKLKIFLSTLIFLVLSGITLSQLSVPASANHTTPITSPITSAMKTLSGFVYFLNNFRFAAAEGATVTAKNKSTQAEYETTVGAGGAYLLIVPAGKYSLNVSMANYKFVPKLNNLPILVDLNLNFFGLPKF